MLPTGKRDKGTALQTIIYTVWTVLISIVPVFGFTGRLQLSVIAYDFNSRRWVLVSVLWI